MRKLEDVRTDFMGKVGSEYLGKSYFKKEFVKIFREVGQKEESMISNIYKNQQPRHSKPKGWLGQRGSLAEPIVLPRRYLSVSSTKQSLTSTPFLIVPNGWAECDSILLKHS